MKRILLILLLLFASCMVVNAQGATDNVQISFDKSVYFGIGAQPIITLVDPDLNLNQYRRDEINVILKSSSDVTGINLTLSEITVDSGVFSVSFNFDHAKSDEKLKRLKIAYNDIITATYNDSNNALGKVVSLSCNSNWKSSTGTVKFDKSLCSGVHTVTIVTVGDQDLNQDPSIIDITSVKVTSDADPSGIVLNLNETGSNTGIFTGKLKFSTVLSSSVNGTIKVDESSDIIAEYVDLANSENKSSTLVTASTLFKYTEAAIETSAQNDFGSGNMVDVFIYDPDANNPLSVDSVLAKIGSGNGSEDLTIRLEETGTDTGQFEQTVYFTDRANNSKLLYMYGRDKINIKYIDHTVPQGGSKEVTKTINWDYQSTVITLDKDKYSGYNTSAAVTLLNMELNNHSDETEYINVSVKTANSKSINLELKETKQNSGKFIGTLYFGRKTDTDEKIIKMSGDDSITISYTNTRNKNDISECYADWTPQDGIITTDRYEYYGDNTPITINLEDWDIAEDSDKKDEVDVTAKAQGSTKKRTVKLTETKRDSGIFAGTLYINGSNGRNPSISLNPGDILEISYTDEDNSKGNEDTKTVQAVWVGVSKPLLILDQSVYKGYGSYITVTLTDPDYNKSTTSHESVEVLIKTSGNNKGTKYALRESGADTGLFTATLKLSGDSSNYNSIRVGETDTIIVTFVDKNVSVSAKFNK